MATTRIESVPTMAFTPASDGEATVVRFRARGVGQPAPHRRPEGGWPGETPARRQSVGGEPSARGNVLAIAVVVTLMAIGSWVISAMEKVEGTPQCVLTDGSPCQPFYVPPPRNHYRPSLVPSIGRG